ncbi:MAG: GntR family transcriptional regulator [Vannielia sp.]|uniref:GntR family transcriptional regulator n=1 Tax=Vannielia sp. TaxID=2813045 RepID=UPI003B8C6770
MTPPARPAEAFAPVTHASAAVAGVVSTLRDEIVRGQIAPGAALGQEALAARFGISRMPVREAIRALEAMGFVTIEANKRARVAGISLADLTDIYEMRVALEGLAIRAAIPHLTEAMIDAAEAIQDRIEGVDAVNFGQLNQAFHMGLYRASGRERLLAQVDLLFNAADRYLCMVTAPEGLRERSDREHRALLAACRARDAGAAEAVLSGHIAHGLEVFRAAFPEL